MMGEGGLGIPRNALLNIANFVYNYWMPWYVRTNAEIYHTYTWKSTALRHRNTAHVMHRAYLSKCKLVLRHHFLFRKRKSN